MLRARTSKDVLIDVVRDLIAISSVHAVRFFSKTTCNCNFLVMDKKFFLYMTMKVESITHF